MKSSSALKAASISILGYFFNYCIGTVASEVSATPSAATSGSSATTPASPDTPNSDVVSATNLEWLLTVIFELSNNGSLGQMVSGSTAVSDGAVSSGPTSGINSNNSPANRISTEELTLLRTRLNHLLKKNIVSNLSEAQLVGCVKFIIQYSSSMDSRADMELQTSLTLLSCIVGSLQEAVCGILTDVHVCCLMLLRSSSLHVRVCSTNVLLSLCTAVPSIATSFIQESLLYTVNEVKNLTNESCNSSSTVEVEADDTEDLAVSAFSPNGKLGADNAGAHSPPRTPTDGAIKRANISNGANPVIRRRSSAGGISKDTERENQHKLQKMYLFHGYCLLMSLLVKESPLFPNGIPRAVISQVYEFGLTCLFQDMRIASSASGL